MQGQWRGVIGFLGVLVLATAPALAQPEPAGMNRPVTRTVTTADGWTLPMDYYYPHNEQTPTTTTQNTPVVILLHGAGGNRLVWKGLATKLQRAGFAVAAVDLRKHGESQAPPGYRGKTAELTPIDYQAMAALDLPAVKRFLLAEHENKKLNIRKTAMVAADDMVPVAMTFAVADWLREPFPDAPTLAARTPRGQDIRAIAMLSPSDVAGRLSANNAARMLNNDIWMVAAWIGVGQEDRADDGAAQVIYDRLTAGVGNERVIFNEFDRVKVRGTELLNLRGINVEGQLVDFLNTSVKTLEAPWRTRISPLE